MDYFDTLILVVISLALYWYYNFKKKLAFFDEYGVPYVKPNIFFGNLADAFLLRKPLHEVYYELYQKLKPHKFGGILMLQKPAYLVRDPELIKNIFVKDFAYFQNRGININGEIEPLGNHLFNLKGEEWKNLRVKLTSTFTTGKMKMMFPLAKSCGEHLETVVDKINSDECFDVKDLVSRYTTDVIASCAFGLETNTLDNPNSEFRRMGKKVFEFRFKTLARSMWPTMPIQLIKFLNLKFLDDTIANFYTDIVNKTVKYREENKVTRYDFLDLMIALKNNTELEKFVDEHNEKKDLEKFMAQIGDKHIKCNVEITNNVVAAQSFLFFIAGFETSSTALSFLMMELAKNKEIQDRVRNEIETVLEKHDNQLTYENMKEMTYTDMVIAEILRKYPPAAVLLRQCNTPYQIPDTKLVIPEQTMIMISLLGLHMDPEYYERPNDFYPEHFTEEAKASRPHYSYMPFGEGPRVCIAERFGKMQVKIGLIKLLRNFSYELSPKMKFPLQYEKNFGLLTVKGGIWLKCQHI